MRRKMTDGQMAELCTKIVLKSGSRQQVPVLGSSERQDVGVGCSLHPEVADI